MRETIAVKPFNGVCPECAGEVTLIGAEDQDDFVIVTYDCEKCFDRVCVMYAAGLIMEE